MTLKGKINPDHIRANKYQLVVVGMPTIPFTAVSGLETENDVIDLPDRTRASGGQPSASEFTVRVPLHHIAEIAAMDAWFQEGQDPITPTYKKAATLIHTSGTGQIVKTYSMLGVWVSKRKLPDLAWEDEGSMTEVEYTLQADIVTPV